MSQEKSKTMTMQIFFFFCLGGGGGGVKGVYYGICTSSESVKGIRSSWL